MHTHRTVAEQEAVRLRAAELLRERRSSAEIVQLLGVSLSSIKRWKKAWLTGGKEALRAKPNPRHERRLSSDQQQQLIAMLRAGALAAGFSSELWTCPRVAELVRQKFGISYHPDHLGRILHDLGFTPQKPRTVASQRDEAAITKWRRYVWPRIKKKRPSWGQASFFSMNPASACNR
jgi:transposase